MLTNTHRAVAAARLNDSQRRQDGFGINRSAVKYEAL